MSYYLDIYDSLWRGDETEGLGGPVGDDERHEGIELHFPDAIPTYFAVYEPACTDGSCERCREFSDAEMIPLPEYKCGSTTSYVRYEFSTAEDAEVARSIWALLQ